MMIESKVYAYASSYSSFNPNDVTEASAISLLYSDMSPDNEYLPENWTYIGTATIVVDYLPKNVIIENKIKTLEHKIKEEYARAERNATELKADIQQLRGITYQGE